MKTAVTVELVEVILIGEVGGAGAGPSRAAGGAGHEVAHVGEEGRGGRGVAVDPAGVRPGRGVTAEVQQGAGGGGGGRGGGHHVPAGTHLQRGDVVTRLSHEERLRGRERIQPILGRKRRNDTGGFPT